MLYDRFDREIKAPTTTIAEAFKRDVDLPTTPRITQPLRQHVWVYSAIRAYQTRISQVTFQLWRGDKEVNTGPVHSLFKNPSHLLSSFQLWEATVGYLMLTGEAFWVLGFPADNTRLPPNQIFVASDRARFEPVKEKTADGQETGRMVGWTFRTNTGRKIFFENNEIVYFRLWNPHDPIRGLSPLDSLRVGMELDWNVQLWGQQFFRNGAVPLGILVYNPKEGGDGMTQEKADEIIEKIEQRHQGTARSNRLALIQGEFDYKAVPFGLKNIEQIIGPRKFHREEVAAVYHVPPVVLSEFEHSNFAKEFVKSQDLLFWRDSLVPLIKNIQAVLKTQFFSVHAPDLEGLFDIDSIEALKEEFDQKVSTGFKLYTMGTPLKEVNRLMDLGIEEDKIPWGEDWWVDTGKVPARLMMDGEALQRNAGPSQDLVADIADRVVDQVKASLGHAINMPSTPPPEHKGLIRSSVREKYWKLFIDRFRPIEYQMRGVLRAFFFELRSTVLQEMFKTPSEQNAIMVIKADDIDDAAREADRFLFNLEEENRRLGPLLQEFFERSTISGGKMIFAELDVADSFTIELPEVRQAVSTQLNKVTGINRTIRDALRRQVAVGIREGENLASLADRVRHVFNVATSRANTIARTEVGTAFQRGRQLAMDRERIPQQEWLSARDEHVRAGHTIDGEIVQRGERFSNGLFFPLDPAGAAGDVINCRCVALPHKA